MYNLTPYEDNYNILAIGEVHGVKENSELFENIYLKFNFEAVALEYPQDCLEDLTKHLKNNTKLTHWFFKQIDDGRFNYEMLNTLKRLYKQNKIKHIICFDKCKDTKNWNERDKDYANSFIEQYKKEFKTLLIAGNWHTKTNVFFSNNVKLYPMLWHLKKVYKNIVTIKIHYTNGQFFNFGLQKFENKNTLEQQVNRIVKIKENEYKIYLNNVSNINY